MGPEWQILIPVWNIVYMLLEKARWDAEDGRREQRRRPLMASTELGNSAIAA